MKAKPTAGADSEGLAIRGAGVSGVAVERGMVGGGFRTSIGSVASSSVSWGGGSAVGVGPAAGGRPGLKPGKVKCVGKSCASSALSHV